MRKRWNMLHLALLLAVIGSMAFVRPVCAQQGNLRVLPDDLEGRYDITEHMVAVEALVVEINEERTRDLGLNFGYTQGDNSSIIDGADVDLGPRFSPVQVPVLIKGLPSQLGGQTDVDFTGTTPGGKLPGLGVSLVGMNVGTGEVSAKLRAMLNTGDAAIRTRPIGTALHNTPLLIRTVDRIPFQNVNTGKNRPIVDEKDVGVTLDVTPRIVSLKPGVVDLNIRNLEVSSVASFITTQKVDRPVFSTSKTNTRVQLGEGETFVIGALKTRRDVHSEDQIPLLGSIPLIGLFFSSQEDLERNSDVLFFITPYILRPGENFLLPYDFKHQKALGLEARAVNR